MARRLLIIEDETAIREALVMFFTHARFSVDAAGDRETAESRLQSVTGRGYDAVLVDLRLDGDDQDGFDLVALARARCPDAKVLLLTAYGSSEVETEARRRGADEVLHKPQPLAEIAHVLELLLSEP
jgi:DNA-binding response OmpR family regulator